MQLVVRTADRVHQAKLDLDPGIEGSTTVRQLTGVITQNFSLPLDSDYFLRSERAGKQLSPSHTLQEAGVVDGDTLELAPIIQAGR